MILTVLPQFAHKATPYFRPFADLRDVAKGTDALVIGNSPWRIGFPLDVWRGPTIGCNALYRDWMPDYLCAFDPDMIAECVEAGCGSKTILVLKQAETRGRIIERVNGDPGHWYTPHAEEMNVGGLCGQMAIGLAGWIGCATITLLGFSANTVNVYMGTDHYMRTARALSNPREAAPGGRDRDLGRIAEGIKEFERLSPSETPIEQRVNWIAPASYMSAILGRNESAAKVAANLRVRPEGGQASE